MRERRQWSSRWSSALAVALLFPAVLLFLDRANLSGSSTSVQSRTTQPAVVADYDPDGLLASGGGSCDAIGDQIRIAGPGVTSCRKREWAEAPLKDQTVSMDVTGVRAGATAIVRIRESAGMRLEIVIGSSRVEIRERTSEGWKVLADVPRSIGTDEHGSSSSAPTSKMNSVVIWAVGDEVEVRVDGRDPATARTSIMTEGEFSLGAVMRDQVAVEFANIAISEAN